MKATGLPLIVIEERTRLAPVVTGSIACRPVAPTPTARLKASVLAELFQVRLLNADPSRPSVQFRSDCAVTTGTLCACAEAITASETVLAEPSVCALIVNAP